MDIVKRWRQFGRHYFWVHLQVGIVAAGFSLALLPGNDQKILHQSSNFIALSRQSVFEAACSQLPLLKYIQEHLVAPINYWTQHAIGTSRHLSIACIPVLMPEDVAPLRVHHPVLRTMLEIVITREVRQPMLVQCLWYTYYIPVIDYRNNIRLSQLQGIRAGPRTAT